MQISLTSIHINSYILIPTGIFGFSVLTSEEINSLLAIGIHKMYALFVKETFLKVVVANTQGQ
jgi:hypothetical protein